MKNPKAFFPACLILFLPALIFPACQVQAQSGGDIMRVGEYTVHTFYSSGTFTPPVGSTEVEVLVVAGGGGGGASDTACGGGGGGAGGLIYDPNYTLTGSVSVIVGTGGAGGTGNLRGANGMDSSFGGLCATGGGGGGGSPGWDADGAPGGSGGGGGCSCEAANAGVGGSGIPGQGYSGGRGLNPGRGGGGGGAGAPGEHAAGDLAGAGGEGIFYSQFTHTGDAGWFAGGGGGACDGLSYQPGLGGPGGGGSGGTSSGSPGMANTGGGGGGGGNGCSGGSGGSGIVIVRYRTVTCIKITGDISLNIGEAVSSAGQVKVEDIDDTSTLTWSSLVDEPNLNKITVQIGIGSLPSGLELRVNRADASSVILSGTARNFITDIGNESRSELLTYRLLVTDFKHLSATMKPLTIEYTIGPQ